MNKGFIQVKDDSLIDGHGQPILLKGVGIGGWLLPEGYMWGSYKEIDRPRRFEALITQELGESYAQHFWKTYYENFFNEDDVKLIKNLGFNSIRIAIDYAVLAYPCKTNPVLELKPEGFKLLDQAIEWCEQHDIYVILDLHGAPGGQTGTNIDNSENDQPELFQNPIYQDQTVFIWETLARRYVNKTIVAAYDLLNEPLPDWFSQYNEMLVPLYKRITKAIRAIDQHHVISIEGTHWSTNFDVFDERFDDQLWLHFHKYWSAPDVESLEPYLEKRNALNLPLYMGEGGENGLQWYYGAFKMYDQKNISWNFWAYKKIENENSIVSFAAPKRWREIFSGEHTLSKDEMKVAFDQFLENIKTSESVVNLPVVNHLFYQDDVTAQAIYYDYTDDALNITKSVQSNLIKSPFRKRDGIEVVNKLGKMIEPEHKHFVKQMPDENDYLYLKSHPKDAYTYSFNISDLDTTQAIQVTVTFVGQAEFDVFLNDQKMILVSHKNHQATYEINTFKASNLLKIHTYKSDLLKTIHFKAIALPHKMFQNKR